MKRAIIRGILIGFGLPFVIGSFILVRLGGDNSESKLIEELSKHGTWWGVAIGVGAAIATVTAFAIPQLENQGRRPGVGFRLWWLLAAPFLSTYAAWLVEGSLMPELLSSNVNTPVVQKHVLGATMGSTAILFGLVAIAVFGKSPPKPKPENRQEVASKTPRLSKPQVADVAAEAYQLLDQATKLECQGREQEALSAYENIVKSYPASAAASDAQKSIESLRQQIG